MVMTLFCLSVVVCQNAKAQEKAPKINIRAGLDTDQIKIGEQIQLTLRVNTDKNSDSFTWANIPDTFNHLMVVDRTPLDTIVQGQQVIYSQKYTITGFDSGRWEIPAFQFHPVHIVDSSVLETYQSNPLSVMVHSVKIDTTQPFKPIKQIREVPFNLLDYWPYLLAVLVLLLVILYFVFFYKKKEKRAKKKIIPEDPPYEQAVKHLLDLEKKGLWKKGETKEYYSELTDILRLYIHRLYEINALEQTSDELLEKIKKITRLNQKREDLKYILQMADLAKFAKLSPLPEEHEVCMNKAKSIVEWNKPQPEKEEDKKEEDKKEKNKKDK